MQCLKVSRRQGQSINVKTPDGHEVLFTVEKTGQGQVKVSICADKSVEIMRYELLGS